MSAPLPVKAYNAVFSRAIRTGLLGSQWVLLETTGRRSGLARITPVSAGRDGDILWVVAEKGQRADYVRNLAADPGVRVFVGRRWRTGRAEVLPDDDATARRAWLERQHGLLGRVDGAVFRMQATEPVTVRIDLA